MPFNVTDFGTNRKPGCDFLLGNNTSILCHAVSKLFADYWSNICCQYLLPSLTHSSRVNS